MGADDFESAGVVNPDHARHFLLALQVLEVPRFELSATVDLWLESLHLPQYRAGFRSAGILAMSQVGSGVVVPGLWFRGSGSGVVVPG